MIIFGEDNRDSSYLWPLNCTPPLSEDQTHLATYIFKKKTTNQNKENDNY